MLILLLIQNLPRYDSVVIEEERCDTYEEAQSVVANLLLIVTYFVHLNE